MKLVLPVEILELILLEELIHQVRFHLLHIDQDDLEELDIRWQVAMMTVRVQRFIQKTRRNLDFKGKQPVTFDKSKALVAQDGLGGYDWSNDFEVEPVKYALMAKWEVSTKNLDEILNSQISARDKTGLGYGTQLNELSSNHGTGNLLTPRADISFAGLDEYTIRNKIIESQTTELNTKTSETAGKTNDANTEKPKSVSESVVSNPKINRDSVIIEDWTSDDEEEVSGVQKVRPENQTVKTRDDKSGQNSHKQGVGFRKVKACFVCRSTEHLIKDCNFHDKKSQESNLKNVVNTGKWESKPVWDNTKRVNHPNFSKYPHLSETFVPAGVSSRTGLHRPSINTARSVCTARPSISTARPVCTARPSINTARPVSTARPSISTARPVCTARPSINTARPVSTVRPSISTARPVYTARPSISTVRPVYASRSIYPRMDNVRPRGSCSPIKRSYYTKPAFRPKDLKQDVKTFGVKNMTTAGKRAVVNTGKGKLDTDLKKSRWVWRPKGNYLDHVSKDSGSFMLKKGNPEILLQDHAVVDSGCSSHMTGNKAYLSDYEDFNGGFVAFGSDPKGDELKFNLFSVSQMCDKKNSVLFTESECLILSPSFKLLDESQVVLRAPRKDDVYSLDLKNIVPSGGTQDSYVAGSSGKDKGPTQEYILLPLQPHRTRIPARMLFRMQKNNLLKNASLAKGIQFQKMFLIRNRTTLGCQKMNKSSKDGELEMMIYSNRSGLLMQ
ncbi:hypothetical protein Tco_1116587 [Tanacetum coccineum]